MPTGNEILSYTGNAALGIASSGGNLSALQTFKNDPLLQTARDLALQNFAANQIIFKQKIEDRNSAFKMLDDEALILDNVLDEDRPLLDKKKKEIEDLFYERSGDIFSDPKVFRDFQKKISDAKSHIKQGQKRYAWAKQEAEDMKKSTSEYDLTKRKGFVNKELSRLQQNFWAMPNPYSPIVDFDATKVFQIPEMGAPTVRQEGDYDITTQTVDVAKTFDKFQKTWADPNVREQFDNAIFGTVNEDGTQRFGGFLSGPSSIKDVARVNAKLAEMRAKGIQVDDLGVELNKVTGKYEATTDRADQIAAKIALADSDAIKETKEFAKERVTAGIQRGNLGEEIRSNKAREAETRRSNLADEATARRNAETARINATKPDTSSSSAATNPEAITTPASSFRDHVLRLKQVFATNGSAPYSVDINAIDPDTKKAMGITKDDKSVVYRSDGTFVIRGKGNKTRVGTLENLKQGYINVTRGGIGEKEGQKDTAQTEGFQKKSEQGFDAVLGTRDAKVIWDNMNADGSFKGATATPSSSTGTKETPAERAIRIANELK